MRLYSIFIYILILSVFVSQNVLGETGKLNIHLEVAPAFNVSGWQKDELGTGIASNIRLEWALKKWIGIEIGSGNMTFFKGSHPDGYVQIHNVGMWTGSAGFRFRLLNDNKGYKYSWGKKSNHTGNINGNLFLDVHALYVRTGDLNRFGADGGLGYEFSLINGIQIGPFTRFTYVLQPNTANNRDSQDAFVISAGLSISFDIPAQIKVMPDTDKDGYYDPFDKCPDNAEDFDDFEDEDGCPDKDNDGDGIFDTVDQCPDEPETINGIDEDDGCPEEALVEVQETRILGGEHIYFDFGLARVKSASDKLLKQLANLLDVHPEYKVITIEGNADSTGSESYNKELSVKRAEKVKEKLVKFNVDANRLKIIGHGEDKPAVEGRGRDVKALNRRVEFFIEEIDDTLKRKPDSGKSKKLMDQSSDDASNSVLEQHKDIKEEKNDSKKSSNSATEIKKADK